MRCGLTTGRSREEHWAIIPVIHEDTSPSGGACSRWGQGEDANMRGKPGNCGRPFRVSTRKYHAVQQQGFKKSKLINSSILRDTYGKVLISSMEPFQFVNLSAGISFSLKPSQNPDSLGML